LLEVGRRIGRAPVVVEEKEQEGEEEWESSSNSEDGTGADDNCSGEDSEGQSGDDEAIVEPYPIPSPLGDITADIGEGLEIHLEEGEIPSIGDEFRTEPPQNV